MTSSALLLLPRLSIQNANAITSPFTWGFPGPPAFTGFAHALSLKLRAEPHIHLTLGGVGIICHSFEPQVSGTYEKKFHLTRNPLSKEEKPASICEEGRAHLVVSLLIAVEGDSLGDGDKLPLISERISEIIARMRLAGGSILSLEQPQFFLPGPLEEENGRTRRQLLRRIMPGFALVGARHRLATHHREMLVQKPEITSIEALLDISSMKFQTQETATDDGDMETIWAIRPRKGWLVPIPVGYHALSEIHEPGAVRNTRDRETPFRFAESIVSLGEWISPHRAADPADLLWHTRADPENSFYLCENSYSQPQSGQQTS